MYDDDLDEVLADSQTIPCAWDGTLDGLGPSIDDTMTNAFMLHQSAHVTHQVPRRAGLLRDCKII